ncbi:aminotransferase [Metarhizium album ARSEF 1941]|uniref:Aminotransferase n=1 Tax=Metarhizium album (strain ARSEF 1941) TaxID=1081103 RepID=A0A0B2X0Y6_METAS|nr:aminotransferase [Metarhizium album ARSEF 1941]KHN99302.1 aminotransferase [Metarhizium album ARSEF 1941]
MTSQLSSGKNHINLMRGWPSPDVLPAAMLSGACQRILNNRENSTAILQYGPNTGHPTLKNELAKWLGEHYNVQTDPSRICVTGGASQSLACILQSFTDPNYTKAIWVIAPCYYLACGIFEDSGFAGKLRAVPEDDEGIDLTVLQDNIRKLQQDEQQKPQLKPAKLPGPTRKLYRHVVYIVPTCANPSGKTMSLRRREGLVRLARRHNALVVCDDVYDFLQWSIDPKDQRGNGSDLRLPRLCDIERSMGFSDQDPGKFGYAISNGSFSKIAGPGVRTGWVEASSKFVIGLGDTSSTLSGGAPSQLCAAILGETLRTGELQRHIACTVCPSLRKRHKLAMTAIHQCITPLGYCARETSLVGAQIYGGYFIWLSPREGVPLSSKLVADVAVKEENLAIGYGCMFEVRGDEGSAPFDGDIRICFAWEAEDALIQGIHRLGSLLKRMLENPAQYTDWKSKADERSSFLECYK